MNRTLQLTIDAGATTCGECEHLYERFSVPRCRLFSWWHGAVDPGLHATDFARGKPVTLRDPRCIQAERDAAVETKP